MLHTNKQFWFASLVDLLVAGQAPGAHLTLTPLDHWAHSRATLVRGQLQPRGGGGGVGLPYKSDEDADQKIQIKALREINVSVAQA